MCSRREVDFSHCTVLPAEGSAESQVSKYRLGSCGHELGGEDELGALRRGRVRESRGPFQFVVDVVVGGLHLDYCEAEVLASEGAGAFTLESWACRRLCRTTMSVNDAVFIGSSL